MNGITADAGLRNVIAVQFAVQFGHTPPWGTALGMRGRLLQVSQQGHTPLGERLSECHQL